MAGGGIESGDMGNAALNLEYGQADKPCTSLGCPSATKHTAVENTSEAPHSIACPSTPRKTQMSKPEEELVKGLFTFRNREMSVLRIFVKTPVFSNKL